MAFADRHFCLPNFFAMLTGVSGRPDLARFGRIVRERRERLGYQQHLMPHGPSSTTVSDIENGDADNLAPLTFRKLDKSLKWEAGSAARTFTGGDPTPLESRTALELRKVPLDELLNEFEALWQEIRLRLVGVDDAQSSWPPAHLRFDDPDESIQQRVPSPRRRQLPG